MKKLTLFVLAITFYITGIANDKNSDVKSYFDGPYVFFEESGQNRTIWVAEGKLFEKEFSPKESFEFAEPSLPNLIFSKKENWASKPKGKYNTSESVIAISDVHGQYDVFTTLLKNHDVVDDQLNWNFNKGHLVVVGDVMDRGDRVMESLWLIYKLERQAEEKGGMVHFLLGNHELMVMNGVLDYLHPKYRYTSALLKTPYDQLFSENTALGKWLSSKNVILKLNDVLYVHGGLSQQAMSLDLGIDGINNLFKKEIYFKDQATIESDTRLFTLYYGDGPLWYRGYAYPYSFNSESIDQILSDLKLKSIVVGHTTLPVIKGLYDNKIVLIDSSIKYGETGQVLLNKNGEYYIGKFDGSSEKLISEEKKVDERKSVFEYLYDKNEIMVLVSEDLKTINKNFENEIETIGKVDLIADKEQFSFTTELKPGGKSRRKICRMPPLKMNFKKNELETFNFIKDIDKMKIVFQCQTSGSMAESIKKEKFLYDLYELVSPYGFRSKMVKIKISDDKNFVEGFIIESDKDFMKRRDIELLKNRTIAPTVVDREEYVKMCLFQFMISNSDWSARKGHNTDLFKRNADNSLVIVPYDFDYSGIIDNSYAVAPENLPIDDVTQRYFMDKTITVEELEKGIAYFLDIENDIYSTCDSASFLSESSQKRMKKFIENFYKIIKDKKATKKLLRK